jgi:hypothetical protein
VPEFGNGFGGLRSIGNVGEILDYLKANKLASYFVGGAPRDLHLGKAVHDVDIASRASFGRLKSLFPDYKAKDFGVAKWVTKDGQQIASLRSVARDSRRRDFTINALYQNAETGRIIDPQGGLNDLKNGLVRSIGNPEERFVEDVSRIPRALRFAGRFGFDIEPGTLRAAHQVSSLAAAGHIAEPAYGRFGKELEKLYEEAPRLAGAHEPLIEGLRHGWGQMQNRPRLTEFGSGWRGLRSGKSSRAEAMMQAENFPGHYYDPEILRPALDRILTKHGSNAKPALIGSGGESTVYDLGNGKVLKARITPGEDLSERVAIEKLVGDFGNKTIAREVVSGPPESTRPDLHLEVSKKLAAPRLDAADRFSDNPFTPEQMDDAMRASTEIWRSTGVFPDTHPGNFGIDNKGRKKLIDYGDASTLDRASYEARVREFATRFKRDPNDWLKPEVIASELAHSNRSTRQTMIEGLRHGGIAQKLRKLLTAFGSGWRGLVSMHPDVMDVINGTNSFFGGFVGGQSASHEELAGYIQKIAESNRLSEGQKTVAGKHLGQALEWSRKTNFPAVLINQKTPRAGLRGVITHERIHAIHRANKNHRFFADKLEEIKTRFKKDLWEQTGESVFKRSIRKKIQLQGLRMPSEPRLKEMAAERMERYGFGFIGDDEFYGRQMGEVFDNHHLFSEMLAHHYEHDRGFFKQAEAAGVPSARRATWELKQAERSAKTLSKGMLRAGESRETVTMASKFLNAIRGARRMSRAL